MPDLPKLRTHGDRLILRPVAADDTTKAGIVIPDLAKDKPQEGEVVARGDEAPALIGHVVLFSHFGGTEITVDEEKLVVIRGTDVLAIREG